ncbi:MAG: SRPBCC family protein [Candidatus Omnitrophica bacterium]|nr:SRPBCC family protein [Candidatus Omnitrophota bacterium]
MKIFHLQKTQFLPISLDEAWDYFSNPLNLMEITPPDLRMTPTSEIPAKMFRGEIITYTLTPMWGLTLTWVTEITHVKERREFIDEQRFGPYKFWHHRHTFKEIENGVEVHDVVHYALPLGVFAIWLDAWWIKAQLEKIFSYRRQVLEDKFGKMNYQIQDQR